MWNRHRFIISAIDDLSGYFLDHCPDDVFWEDYDAELDGVRSDLQDIYDRLLAVPDHEPKLSE